MQETVGFIGYGRFGHALGELFAESGFAVRAYDAAGVAGAVGAASPAELAAASSVIVLAVPIGAMRRALLEARPHLGAGHLVLDVGSVKTLPLRAMAEVLGDAVPWIGSHPLFGPTSLTLGERPLRVVLTPAAEGSQAPATQRARALFHAIGCVVTELDAETHDRIMAETHALAYFVAKGMIDSGMRLDTENAPPSSRAILRTVEAVRSDAGHLFAALHLDNPYAPEVRRRFLDTLAEIDRNLAEAGPTADETQAGPLAIPDLGEASPEIREVRDLIDDVDREIVALLSRRAWLARRAGRAKASLGVGVRDLRREAQLLSERRAWAEAAGIDADIMTALFEEVLRFSRRIQQQSPPG